MNWTVTPNEEVSRQLEVEIEQGLSQTEIAKRQEKYGYNQLEEEKGESLLKKVGHHLSDVTSIILLLATGIAAYLAITADGGWLKVWVIAAIIVINVCIGIYQETSAEKALAALMAMSSQMVTVLRGGQTLTVDAVDLVPGDVLVLKAGDSIPADARIMTAQNLMVDEAVLTGESLPVEKTSDVLSEVPEALGDHLNCLYSGCSIVQGNVIAVVTEIGMQTEIGKIAALLNNTKKLKTLLQERLAQLALNLSFVAVIAGLIIFAVGTIFYGETLLESLMIAVSLAVAAVPETLPIIVTITLAFGIQNMVKRDAIIRRITAVESIGNVSVICSDKTGTLTQNKMKLTKWWFAGHPEEVLDYVEELNDDQADFLSYLSLVTNATIEVLEDNEVVEVGDSTELAIIRLLHQFDLTRTGLEWEFPRVGEHPFDSERKLMSTLHKTQEGKYLLITKGAFDRLPVNKKDPLLPQAQEIHDQFAQEALRVLSVGYRYFDEMPDLSDWSKLETELTLYGLIGLIDPPRPEAKESVQKAKEAGIKTVMITGDHLLTAQAIAQEIGIFSPGDLVLTGAQLSQLSQAELEARIYDYSVYARVSPEDKIRIVQAWQANDEIVVMTGDGVNDAPALKAADVGAAMGITGTDVSKGAADMILTDDNFATIIDAVEEGRTVYANIIKTVQFLVSVNFAQIAIMLLGVIVGWGAPLVAVQLLLINVLADGIPGFYLSREKSSDQIMNQPPIGKEAGIFANKLGLKIGIRSVAFTICSLLSFYLGRFVDLSENVGPNYQTAMSMTFLTLALGSIFSIFAVKTDATITFQSIVENRPLFYSASFSIILILMISMNGILQEMFELSSLSGIQLLIAIALSLVPTLVTEIGKKFIK